MPVAKVRQHACGGGGTGLVWTCSWKGEGRNIAKSFNIDYGLKLDVVTIGLDATCCMMQKWSKMDLALICKLDRENAQSRPPSKTNYTRESRKLFWQNWLYPSSVLLNCFLQPDRALIWFSAAFVRFPTLLWTSSFELGPVKACLTPIPDLLP